MGQKGVGKWTDAAALQPTIHLPRSLQAPTRVWESSMKNPFDLSGKVAIVPGANAGIGQGIALALARAGADIAAVGRSPADETVARIRDMGRKAEIIAADLSSIEPVQRVVDETLDRLGGLGYFGQQRGHHQTGRRAGLYRGGLGRCHGHQPEVCVFPMSGGGAPHG